MKIVIYFFLLVSVFGYSQKTESEYYETKKGDTVYGNIVRKTNHLNPAKITFKSKNKTGIKILLYPNEIKTIRSYKGVDGDCIIKTAYDKWFVKLIIDGKIQVYQQIDGVLFYTSKDGSEIAFTDFGGFTSRKKSHSNVRGLLSDNPYILREFDSLSGSQKNILNIIKKYNAQVK